MRKFLQIILFSLLFLTKVNAETKDLLYDGKEIYAHVKKDHLTTIAFPEPIKGVVRGFGAGQDHTIPESSFFMTVKKGDYYLLTRAPIINVGAASDSANVTASFRPIGV